MVMIKKCARLSLSWLIDWAKRSGIYFAGGMLVCWLIMNAMAGPGVSIMDQVEAEGPQFSDPRFLDVVSTITRKRSCSMVSQPWVWRKVNDAGALWHEGDGEPTIQAIPLRGTVAPFLAPNGRFILTLPASEVPDPEHGGWQYRTVRDERCSLLPAQIGLLFGSAPVPSPDVPVNFVGAPHKP